MITIQATMLVMLGFLLAMLLTLALAPAFRRRAERLTMERVRQSMPMTEAEIIADKDRLRAQFAIRVHKLEQELDKFRLAAARHIVDINRRDATVASLESEVERFKADQEENINARRVLEHTISDRVPKIEQRLSEARKLLEQRDHEMAALSSEATRGIRARDEAMQANLQQRVEIDRLKAALGTRPRERFHADGALDGDAGNSIREDAQSATARLASENQIAALKAKVDDQTTEISRLKASLEAYESGKESASRSGKIVSKSASRPWRPRLKAKPTRSRGFVPTLPQATSGRRGRQASTWRKCVGSGPVRRRRSPRQSAHRVHPSAHACRARHAGTHRSCTGRGGTARWGRHQPSVCRGQRQSDGVPEGASRTRLRRDTTGNGRRRRSIFPAGGRAAGKGQAAPDGSPDRRRQGLSPFGEPGTA